MNIQEHSVLFTAPTEFFFCAPMSGPIIRDIRESLVGSGDGMQTPNKKKQVASLNEVLMTAGTIGAATAEKME